MKKGKGFTLIELLVVIAIMSILTMITVSQFTTARRKARDVSRKSDLNSVSKAVYMYYADYGVFPAKDKIQDKWGMEFSDDGYVYMKVLPKEKENLPDYCYVVSADKKSFALFAILENTSDADCKIPGYAHCGGTEYCYSVASQNALVTDFASID